MATIKEQCKQMATKFFEWFNNQEHNQAEHELTALKSNDDVLDKIYDIWLEKYFIPETINPSPSTSLEQSAVRN